jgi:prepilin-type N-terminal cleavage/methylation domain-containing protein
LKHSVSAKLRPDACAGFSMIEMLAALAIAGAMFAVVSEFAGRALLNWNRGEQTIAVMEMMTRGVGRLSTDLSLAVPMSPPGSDGSTVYFLGEPNHIQFVAATGFGSGSRGIELLDIVTLEDSGDTLLVRRRGLVTDPPRQFRDPVTLLHGRLQIRFSYRDRDGQRVTTWIKKAEFPASVILEVLNATGGNVFAAPFVLPVMANLSVDCLIAPDEGKERPPRCETPDDKTPAKSAVPKVGP